MEKEVYLINISEFDPKIYNILRKNMLLNRTTKEQGLRFPLTLNGLKEFGLAHMYDFSEVPEVLDPTKLDVVLKVCEKQNVVLTMTQEEFDAIEFDILIDPTVKERMHEVLVKHEILSPYERKSRKEKIELEKVK